MIRKYNSLPKYKKDALKTFSIYENFGALTTKADNFVKNNFLKIAMVADNLNDSAFGVLDSSIMPMIIQYLQFEDSSIKVAGANFDKLA